MPCMRRTSKFIMFELKYINPLPSTFFVFTEENDHITDHAVVRIEDIFHIWD
jgi:hypothetical protein